MLGHKTSLNKFFKSGSIFSNHNDMKLEINNRKKTGKFTNMWKSNNISNNQSMGQGKNQKEIQKYLEINENGNSISKLMRCKQF